MPFASHRSTLLVITTALIVATACGHAARQTVSTSATGTPAPSVAPSAAPSAAPGAATAATAAPVESNPSGDIPDSQQFVDYRSPAGGYGLKTPEGWARTEKGTSVAFTDKLHQVWVDLVSASHPRTLDEVRQIDVPQVGSQVEAFAVVTIAPAGVPGGPSVLLRYRDNSKPNDVTGKVTRMEIDRYEIYSNGRLALLSLAAPAGADNVDDWRLISQSFRWTG